jgi:hypothetical protein
MRGLVSSRGRLGRRRQWLPPRNHSGEISGLGVIGYKREKPAQLHYGGSLAVLIKRSANGSCLAFGDAEHPRYPFRQGPSLRQPPCPRGSRGQGLEDGPPSTVRLYRPCRYGKRLPARLAPAFARFPTPCCHRALS